MGRYKLNPTWHKIRLDLIKLKFLDKKLIDSKNYLQVILSYMLKVEFNDYFRIHIRTEELKNYVLGNIIMIVKSTYS